MQSFCGRRYEFLLIATGIPADCSNTRRYEVVARLHCLSYHWELWAIQSGRMKNHDALKVATILGAEALGLDYDLGSIQKEKLADLVILDKIKPPWKISATPIQ